MKPRTNKPRSGRAENKLFEDDFFIPFDGQLFSDIQERKLTPTEFCVYSMLLRQATFETGIWVGSGYRICFGWGGQLNQRTVQNSLKCLRDKELIKSFHRRGQRSDYAVAIHNYRVRYGKWRGYKLDASATTDIKNPVYRRDSAAAAKSPCDDSESSTKSLRSDTEVSANPIAGNTPEPQSAQTTQLIKTKTYNPQHPQLQHPQLPA